jgi:hypothetical protein
LNSMRLEMSNLRKKRGDIIRQSINEPVVGRFDRSA